MEDHDRAQDRGSTPGAALASVLEPFSPLALHVHRAAGAVVGRQAEQDAIRQELASAATGRLAGLAVEGEPGIGKTRLLLAAGEMARRQGSRRSRSPQTRSYAAPSCSRVPSWAHPKRSRWPRTVLRPAEALAGSLDSMSGQDDPGLATLPADRRLLRTFDLGAVAFRALAAVGPLAVLVDDLQWSDDDSLRLLRYVIRSDATSPIFLMLAIRPEEFALVTEAVNLLADMDRMGLLRRMKVDRFTQSETRDLVAAVLGGPVDASGAAVMHAQAEGVPFIVEEMARAYRDGGMIQQIDGVWRLARNAERLVPSAVKTLISRRAAHLPDETKAIARGCRRARSPLQPEGPARGRAPRGRHVARARRAGARARAGGVGGTARRARRAGGGRLQLPARAGPRFRGRDADPGAAASDPRRDRRTSALGRAFPREPPAARATTRRPRATRPCASASRSRRAGTRWPRTRPKRCCASSSSRSPPPRPRRNALDLLEARDRALDMLRRPSDRLEGLAELAALAEALGDSHLELDVRLRRAAALRTAEEYDRAAQLAREVRELATERDDRGAELAACMELGQDLVRATAGEAFTPVEREVDLDGADEAFRRAIELARELGDDPTLAAALRESRRRPAREGPCMVHRTDRSSVRTSRSRSAWPPARYSRTCCPSSRSRRVVYEASGLFQEALELFERLGDRRGVMASIIAMGYLSWAPDIHLGSSSARHIEEIRRLTSKAKAFTNESERAAFEAQMLYGVHVFARAKVIPDLALSRGEQAHAHAREIGDPLARVPGGRRHGDGAPRHGRGRPGDSRGSTERRRSPRSIRPRSARGGWRPGAGSHVRPPVTPRGCGSTWSGPCSSPPRSGLPAVRCEALARLARGGVAARGRARGRRPARSSPSARPARLRDSRPSSRATRRGGRRRTRRSRRSSSHEAGPRRPPITRARRWRRCSRGCTRTGTWTSCCRSRTRPDGERCARVGSDAVPPAAHARDDRAAHDGRGRACPMVPRTDSGAR